MTRSPEVPRRGALHRLLLSLPAEAAHDAGIAMLKTAQSTWAGRRILRRHAARPEPRVMRSKLGLTFPNPVGLAAGFDKNGEVVGAVSSLGFGWIEVGTVTPRPQQGNPKPRLFRYPQHRSLENRMGFNNAGAEALARRLRDAWPAEVPLGVNLGKNKDTPNADAVTDYLVMVELFKESCDYFVINVSSPNTPGLRDLQDRTFLAEVLHGARETTPKPVLVKLSPDLEAASAVDLSRGAIDEGAAGIILTNTTSEHTLLPEARGIGGLSGEVLREKSFRLFDAVAAELFGGCLLVGVGGIDSGREVYRRIRAGADLVQLYTAFVYQGPGIVRSLTEELVELLDRDGYELLDDAVGVDRSV